MGQQLKCLHKDSGMPRSYEKFAGQETRLCLATVPWDWGLLCKNQQLPLSQDGAPWSRLYSVGGGTHPPSALCSDTPTWERGDLVQMSTWSSSSLGNPGSVTFSQPTSQVVVGCFRLGEWDNVLSLEERWEKIIVTLKEEKRSLIPH